MCLHLFTYTITIQRHCAFSINSKMTFIHVTFHQTSFKNFDKRTFYCFFFARILITIIFGKILPLTSITGGDILDDSTMPHVIRARYKNLGRFDKMYIMADLEEEVILVVIKYRPTDGLLLIYPDFNNIETNPYLKEIDADSRHMYQYSIENLSTDRKQTEWSMRKDMDKLANKVRLKLLFSIYSIAMKFLDDDFFLCVRYIISR